jgi:hypothetical protein
MSVHRRIAPGRRRAAVLLALVGLVLLAFALRVYRLDAYSFWTDEGLTPERAGYAVGEILRNVIVIQGFPSKDTHPPFYYLVIHATRALFGESDFAYRYPSVLFGVLLVPVLYALGRRMGGRALGLLVALLAAVNPLQVYYAQEARMYTLLVLLGAAASLILWLALSDRALSRPRLVRLALVYALLAGLMVYTHYTAVFLVAAQALFWAWLLWRAGLKWLILGAAALAVLVAIPLIPYTVPRLFTGAEANYIYVSPLVILKDVIHFFYLGLTTNFNNWWVKALDVVALILALIGFWAAGLRAQHPWIKRLFLLSWLLAVALGLMAGSLVKPMYQGVRHIMLGSPAFLLLVGFGILGLAAMTARGRPTSDHDDPNQAPGVRRLPSAIAMAGLGVVLAGCALALYNLYDNPVYAKDDFRGLVRFIEQRAGASDVVVYNNAVLLPVHEHYRLRDDLAVTALPVYPQFATGQEPELETLGRDYERIWFVTNPPGDGRDEGKLVQAGLDADYSLVINQLFPSRTTESRVRTYRTGREAAAEQPLSASWEGLPALAGIAVAPGPLSVPALWIDLVWDGARPPDDTPLRLALIGPDGAEYVVYGHTLLRDDEAWAAGDNTRSYDLPLPPGLPPGSYTLTARAGDGREAVTLATVEVAPSSAWPASPEALYAESELDSIANRPPAIRFKGGPDLRGVELWDDSVLPGNTLPLTVFWQTGAAAQTGVRYRLDVIGPDGEVTRSQETAPGAPWLETLPANTLLREVTGLYFNPETPAGRYWLRWTMLRDGEELEPTDVAHGVVDVQPWPKRTDLPEVETVTDAAFGDAIRLYGYDLGDFAPGSDLPLTLVWQATAEPPVSYLVFVHLISEATGEIVSQVDRLPVDGLRPTNGWRAGEVLLDGYGLSVPAGLPPGRYHLNVGFYNPDDGQRPPVTDDGAPQADNQLRLATFEVP